MTPSMPAVRPVRRVIYVAVLSWAFTLFSSVRIVAYLPTVWAIHESGDTSAHSLWTWFAWFGSNLTMAAWLYEQQDRKPNRAVFVSGCNALMCALVIATIGWYRLTAH